MNCEFIQNGRLGKHEIIACFTCRGMAKALHYLLYEEQDSPRPRQFMRNETRIEENKRVPIDLLLRFDDNNARQA